MRFTSFFGTGLCTLLVAGAADANVTLEISGPDVPGLLNLYEITLTTGAEGISSISFDVVTNTGAGQFGSVDPPMIPQSDPTCNATGSGSCDMDGFDPFITPSNPNGLTGFGLVTLNTPPLGPATYPSVALAVFDIVAGQDEISIQNVVGFDAVGNPLVIDPPNSIVIDICDDSNVCTIDVWDTELGCQNQPISCDDLDACTADSCHPALGCQNEPLSCDDLDDCTADSCDVVTGCANAPVAGCTAPDPPPPGHLVVLDADLDTVFAVDPGSGDRAILSSPSVGSGDPLSYPISLARSPDGRIFVTESTWPAIVEIDPDTGDRTAVSGCEDAACTSVRGRGFVPLHAATIAWESDDSLVAVAAQIGRVLRIDLATGDQTTISAEGPALGPEVRGARAVLLEPSGAILVVASITEVSIVRVDPSTGTRTLVSGTSKGSGPALPVAVADMSRLPSGDLLLATASRVVWVDIVTGDRGQYSGPAVGSGATHPSEGVTVDASGDAYVCGTDSVYHVDPVSRDRMFVSTPTLGTGTPLSDAVDIALPAQPTASSVPALSGYALAVLAALLLAVALAISRARVA